ncbi:MAG: TIGR00730 family Rossman fold protein [Nitriliruptoraceae bacterium]
MRVTVYAASSGGVDQRFHRAARALGERLAARGDALVYGGTALGLMGELATAVRAGGGHVTGVIPSLMADRGLADTDCDELVITAGMGERKRAMIDRAEAFVALPGGFGTLEELLEVLTLRQLGVHDRPVVLLDVDGFFQPLLATFEHLFELGFADRTYAGLWAVAHDVDEVFAHLDDDEPGALPTKPY